MNKQNKIKRGNKYLTWTLRIFLLLVSLFFMLFSFDVFSGEYSFWNKVLAFLMHNIFTFALLIILFIAWKREHIGGILLLAVGIFMIFFFGGPLNLMYGTWIMIGLPVLTGILFLCNYYLIKKKSN
ncbi:MAG: hypothetical protein K8R54_08840 [Bacteroidales bacterium]|nr:hypothetical protein [Bacteroidales bacterium]